MIQYVHHELRHCCRGHGAPFKCRSTSKIDSNNKEDTRIKATYRALTLKDGAHARAATFRRPHDHDGRAADATDIGQLERIQSTVSLRSKGGSKTENISIASSHETLETSSVHVM